MSTPDNGDYQRIQDAFVGDVPAGDVPEPARAEGSLEQRLAAVEHKVAVVTYLHAELVFKTKQAAARQILSNPAIRERLEQALVAGMDRTT